MQIAISFCFAFAIIIEFGLMCK